MPGPFWYNQFPLNIEVSFDPYAVCKEGPTSLQKGTDMVKIRAGITCVLLLGLLLPVQTVLGATVKDIQAQGTAMMKDAEDMVAHGGMGDTKAIVHHCGEVSRHAGEIVKVLPPTDPHGKEALSHLLEAIKQCRRVTELGDKVDPGASLNPAIKARAAAREAVKHLAALRESGA